jgi:hypothetical protein
VTPGAEVLGIDFAVLRTNTKTKIKFKKRYFGIGK